MISKNDEHLEFKISREENKTINFFDLSTAILITWT